MLIKLKEQIITRAVQGSGVGGHTVSVPYPPGTARQQLVWAGLSTGNSAHFLSNYLPLFYWTCNEN